MRRLLLTSLLALVLISASAPAAHAGIASFIDGCVASVGDFSGLGARLEASGMKEVDPAQGPQPMIGAAPQRQRLWQTLPAPAGIVDAFTGYAVDDFAGAPAEICFHVSRPGESAAIAVPELKDRYPPVGDTRSLPYVFYGGVELWEARIDGVRAIVGVAWAMKSWPGEGTSILYLIKPRAVAPAGLPRSTTPAG